MRNCSDTDIDQKKYLEETKEAKPLFWLFRWSAQHEYVIKIPMECFSRNFESITSRKAWSK